MKKVIALLIVFSAVIAFAAEDDKSLPSAVSVLMTNEERESYKKLKSDSDKQKFVEEFWSKRDPSPGTPENELRTELEGAVQKINGLNIPSRKGREGVETDMGATLLLLGQPSEQKDVKDENRSIMLSEDREMGTSEEPPAKKVWIYANPPKEIAGEELKVEFTADPGGGEWQFSDRRNALELLEKGRQRYLAMAQQGQSQAAQQQQPQAPGQPQTPQQMPAQPPQQAVVTPELKSALDATATGAPPTDIPMNWIQDSFMTSDGIHFITVAMQSSADTTTARAGVRLMNGAGATVKEMEEAFAKEGEEAGYHQASVTVDSPGDYTVVTAVTNGSQAGGAKETVTVPAYGQEFSVSSLILAKRFSQLPEAKPEKEPYTFGKIKVHPSIDHVFSKTDELIIVYEAYNFQLDPTGKPNLEVQITFQQEKGKPQKTAPSAPNGLVTGKKITIPTSFPLQSFPAGQYKLILQLTDKATGQSQTTEESFEIK